MQRKVWSHRSSSLLKFSLPFASFNWSSGLVSFPSRYNKQHIGTKFLLRLGGRMKGIAEQFLGFLVSWNLSVSFCEEHGD